MAGNFRAFARNFDRAATLARGAATIIGDRDPFATVWIANNLDYIQRLGTDGADRAPAGMVALTAAELGK